MTLSKYQLTRFADMIKDFGNIHNLHGKICTTADNKKSTVIFEIMETCARQEYTVIWDEVRSLTEAATAIQTDVIRRFNLDNYSGAPEIEKVVFNNPATIVLWKDGTKTVVKCQAGDEYSKETGLAMCIAKKCLGNEGNFNNVFRKWIPDYEEEKTPKKPVRVPVRNRGAFDRFLDRIVEELFPVTEDEKEDKPNG